MRRTIRAAVRARQRDVEVEVVVDPLEAVRLANGGRRGVRRRPLDALGVARVRAGEPRHANRADVRPLEELERVVVPRDGRRRRLRDSLAGRDVRDLCDLRDLQKRDAEDRGPQAPEDGPERPRRMRISGSASSLAVAISASRSF